MMEQEELDILSEKMEYLTSLTEKYRKLVAVVPADDAEQKLQDFNRGLLEQYEQELELMLKELGEQGKRA